MRSTLASRFLALASHTVLRGLRSGDASAPGASRDGRTAAARRFAHGVEAPDVQLAVLPASCSERPVARRAPRSRARPATRIVIGWDSFAQCGAVPHALDRDGADFAFWCHYKWLNAVRRRGGLY